MGPTVADIKQRLHEADEREFAVLERSLVADARKGVRDAVERARARLAAEAAERQRLASLYAFERALAAGRGDGVIVGLDEVGRGPLAGPLAVGAVVLPAEPFIEGLNDSKQVTPKRRDALYDTIRTVAVAWAVARVEAEEIDATDILSARIKAMQMAIDRLEPAPGFALIDGNRDHGKTAAILLEHQTVVKGDSLSASIAAASILAKVSRDRYMEQMAERYPEYEFERHKGYGTKRHYELLRRYGPCPIHRRTFLKKL